MSTMYRVKITACPEPSLIGKEFYFSEFMDAEEFTGFFDDTPLGSDDRFTYSYEELALNAKGCDAVGMAEKLAKLALGEKFQILG